MLIFRLWARYMTEATQAVKAWQRARDAIARRLQEVERVEELIRQPGFVM